MSQKVKENDDNFSEYHYVTCNKDDENTLNCSMNFESFKEDPRKTALSRNKINSNKPPLNSTRGRSRKKSKGSTCIPLKKHLDNGSAGDCIESVKKSRMGSIGNFIRNKLGYLRSNSYDRNETKSGGKLSRNENNGDNCLEKMLQILNPSVLSEINQIINSPNMETFTYLLPYILSERTNIEKFVEKLIELRIAKSNTNKLDSNPVKNAVHSPKKEIFASGDSENDKNELSNIYANSKMLHLHKNNELKQQNTPIKKDKICEVCWSDSCSSIQLNLHCETCHKDLRKEIKQNVFNSNFTSPRSQSDTEYTEKKVHRTIIHSRNSNNYTKTDDKAETKNNHLVLLNKLKKIKKKSDESSCNCSKLNNRTDLPTETLECTEKSKLESYSSTIEIRATSNNSLNKPMKQKELQNAAIQVPSNLNRQNSKKSFADSIADAGDYVLPHRKFCSDSRSDLSVLSKEIKIKDSCETLAAYRKSLNSLIDSSHVHSTKSGEISNAEKRQPIQSKRESRIEEMPKKLVFHKKPKKFAVELKDTAIQHTILNSNTCFEFNNHVNSELNHQKTTKEPLINLRTMNDEATNDDLSIKDTISASGNYFKEDLIKFSEDVDPVTTTQTSEYTDNPFRNDNEETINANIVFINDNSGDNNVDSKVNEQISNLSLISKTCDDKSDKGNLVDSSEALEQSSSNMDIPFMVLNNELINLLSQISEYQANINKINDSTKNSEIKTEEENISDDLPVKEIGRNVEQENSNNNNTCEKFIDERNDITESYSTEIHTFENEGIHKESFEDSLEMEEKILQNITNKDSGKILMSAESNSNSSRSSFNFFHHFMHFNKNNSIVKMSEMDTQFKTPNEIQDYYKFFLEQCTKEQEKYPEEDCIERIFNEYKETLLKSQRPFEIESMSKDELLEEKSHLEQTLFMLDWDFGWSKKLKSSYKFQTLKKRYELVRALLNGLKCQECGSEFHLTHDYI